MNNAELLKKMDQIILLLQGQFAYQQPTKKTQIKKKQLKRGSDMQRGSITYRNDGRWMGRCYDENGKQKCVYGRTKKECTEKLRIMIDDIERKKRSPQANTSMTLSEYFELWLNLYKSPILKESSIMQLKRLMHRHLKDIGLLQIKNITPQMLQAVINSIASQKERDITYSNLNQLYEKLFFMGAIPQNIMGMVVVSKSDKNTIKEINSIEDKQILELGEENNFVYKPIESKYKDFIEFAINTGMRPAEILGLQKKDIDFGKKCISINKQMNTTTGKLSSPKSKRGNRIIPLFNKTEEILMSMDIDLLNDDDFIFNLKYHSIQQFLERLSEKQGVSITCKTFRKTFSSRCQHLYGIDQKQVQIWLGHESSETTNKHYTFISNEETLNNINKYNSSVTHIADTY